MPRPTYQPMTITQALYDAVCERVSQEFADSYLTGATLIDRKLTPRTVTAWQTMRDSFVFRKFLKDVGIELVRPLRFQEQAAGISHKEIFRVVH